jgi:hypothetical protein
MNGGVAALAAGAVEALQTVVTEGFVVHLQQLQIQSFGE